MAITMTKYEREARQRSSQRSGQYPASFIGPLKPGQSRGGVPVQQSPLVQASPNFGGSGGGQPASGGGGVNNAPYESTPQQPQIDWDAMIAPSLSALDQAEAASQSGYSAGVSEAEATRSSQTAKTTQNIGEQEQVLEQGRGRQQNMATSAMDEARRQFSEIQQGLQGRYGKSTGTGAFASELAGRETFRGIGNIRQGLTDAMSEIDTKLQQVKEIGRIALQDIDDDLRVSKEKLKANLDSQLAQVRGERGQLQQWKAQKASEAIQGYRSQVQDIEARNTAFKQQLFLNQQSAEQKLQQAMQRGQKIAESFKLYNVSIGGINTPVRVGDQGTVQNLQGQPVNIGQGSTLYDVGSYPSDKDDFQRKLEQAAQALAAQGGR